MSRRPLLALCALAVGLLLAGSALTTSASAVDRTELAQALTARTAKLGSRSAALVRDLTTGTTLFERRRGLGLAPASNEKLYTTAAALLKWGPDARLVTRVKAKVLPDAQGVLAGDVVLVGAGDPGLNDASLRNLAADLYRVGVRRITGRVLGDERRFDTRRGGFSTGWGPDGNLGGWLSGLTWGHGRVGTDGPAATAAARLRTFLQSAKVTVKGAARRGSDAAATRVLGTVSSATMTGLVQTTLVPSDNFYAEMLMKGLGAEFGGAGTSTAGARVVTDTMATFGLHPTIRDGSGLSASNKTSPSQIVSLLTQMAARPEGAAWRAGMPQPGRSGTLAKRMRGTAAVTRCRAKTGTLHNVSALSGYCTVAGHELAFSFLENDIDPLYAKAIEDQMVPLIAGYEPSASTRR